jgi:hypothetical protein
MMNPNAHASVAAFFAAMNANDADGAAALVGPQVEIMFGPNTFVGRDAVRGLALQQDPQLLVETTPISFETAGDDVRVEARRVQRWRDSGELAGDEPLQARFALDVEGLIIRIELSSSSEV